MWSVVLEKANPLLHSKQATQPLKLIHPAFEASKSLEAQYETFPVFLPRPGQLSLCHAWAFLKGVHEKLIFDSFRIPGKSGHTKTALLGQAEEAIQFALCSLCFSLSCCFSLLFCHRFHCSFGLIFFLASLLLVLLWKKTWGGSQGSHYFVYWLWSPLVLLPPDPSSFCVALLIFLTCTCIGMYKDASICMYINKPSGTHIDTRRGPRKLC